MSRTRISSHWIGRLAGTGQVIRSAEQFVLAGLEWSGVHEAVIELRAESPQGRWSRWVNASVQGHDSDGGRSPSHALFGEPIWTGQAVAVQLRSSAEVHGVTVHLVAARRPMQRLADPTSTTRAATAASALPLAMPQLGAGPGQPPIIARKAWAGRGNGPEFPPEYGDVRMAFVHHSASANGYSAGEVPSILLGIYDFHRYVRGWYDIGYNFAIDAFGRIWEAREGGIDQAVVGAQAGGYNLESTGAVILGTFTDVLPSGAALHALEQLLAWKLALHGVPVSGEVTVEVDPPDAYWTRFAPGAHVVLPRIAGHRQGCTTDCPGNALFGYLPSARSRVASIVGPQVALTLTATGQKPANYLNLASVHSHYGTPLNVSGDLRGLAGKAVSNAEVELQALIGQVESVIGQATTDPTGHWSAQLMPQEGMLLRALHADPPATASPLIGVAVSPHITLQLQQPGGSTVVGTVAPWKKQVVLTVRTAGGHTLLTRDLTTTAGDFSHGFSLPPGRYTVQAATAADARTSEGFSEKLLLVIS